MKFLNILIIILGSKIFYCESSNFTCKNGGKTLKIGKDNFKCKCPLGYKGTYCESNFLYDNLFIKCFKNRKFR